MHSIQSKIIEPREERNWKGYSQAPDPDVSTRSKWTNTTVSSHYSGFSNPISQSSLLKNRVGWGWDKESGDSSTCPTCSFASPSRPGHTALPPWKELSARLPGGPGAKQRLGEPWKRASLAFKSPSQILAHWAPTPAGLKISLVGQGLRLHPPRQGVHILSLVGKLRSHMSCSQKIKT